MVGTGFPGLAPHVQEHGHSVRWSRSGTYLLMVQIYLSSNGLTALIQQGGK